MTEGNYDHLLGEDDAWEIWDADSNNAIGFFSTYEEAYQVIKNAQQNGASYAELSAYRISGPNGLAASFIHALWDLKPGSVTWRKENGKEILEFSTPLWDMKVSEAQ